MEIIRGKHSTRLDGPALERCLAGATAIHIDLGTGDGRFVQHSARQQPQRFVIGIDACRDALRETSRRALPNTLYVIAAAQALPPLLYGRAQHLTIFFPWGSLLHGLLTADAALLTGLAALAQPGATLEIALNGGALHEAGCTLAGGAAQARAALAAYGFRLHSTRHLTAAALRDWPTTWAKRLAWGRDPQALHLRGQWQPR
ncbi:MAG: class I SAM-dependent methyltransferase [Anaerolineae bacterium]|jgi:16S rRNA (adenine(1408)-N(1))-methyltransferase|nr:class I SAM-dependent methyltransferase [Anaerolineae bacterium]